MAGRRDIYKRRRKQSDAILNHLLGDWHDRIRYSLDALISSSNMFNEDIETVKKDKNLNLYDKALFIINKYQNFGLRFHSWEFVANYIERGEVNPFYIVSPVIGVSTKENIAGPSMVYNDGAHFKKLLDTAMQKHPNEWMYLLINPECTREDMEDWIASYWDIFIKGRLEKISPNKPKRINVGKLDNFKRDMEIFEHIVIQKNSAKIIADKYDIEPEYARKIATTVKKKFGNHYK